MFAAKVFPHLNCQWLYYFLCTIQTVVKVLLTLRHEHTSVNFSNSHVALDTNDLNRIVMVLILRTICTNNIRHAEKWMKRKAKNCETILSAHCVGHVSNFRFCTWCAITFSNGMDSCNLDIVSLIQWKWSRFSQSSENFTICGKICMQLTWIKTIETLE